MPARVLGYARVSSSDQALGTSLQDQQNVIRAHAQKRGLNVARMYVEAESAVYERAERREQVQALMADVRRGDIVLVDKVDRWSRDPEFTYRSIREILAAGASFYAVGDNCDPSTPEGDTMLNFRVLFAKEEHKRIKLRMVGTRRTLRDRGYYPEGLPPWGYVRQDVRGADRNALLIDEEEAARVRRAFELCVEGYSMSQIAESLGVDKSRVAITLRKRTYLGEVLDTSGTWIKGQHAGIIDARLFVDAQHALDRRRNGSRSAHKASETVTWWLRDLARCASCKGKLSAAYAGPKDARRHYFYCYARCVRDYIPVRWVEEKADPIVMARLVDLRDELAGAKSEKKQTAPRVSIDARLAKLQAKRARYLEMYADGTMAKTELHAAIAKLDLERPKLDALVQAPVVVSPEQRRNALRNIVQIQKAWARSNATERRLTVATLARAVFLAVAKAPAFDWYSVEELLRHS